MTIASIDERYEAATNTSNLKVVSEKAGAGDVLIAAGWSQVRVGAALMRLHGEWEGSAKKPRMSDSDLLLLRARLKSLRSVLELVSLRMEHSGIHDAQEKVGPIVGYWLHRICPTCRGQAFELIRDTPVLGNIRCKSCHGTGVGQVPWGDEGRRVMGWLDECVYSARQSIKHRLHRR